MMLPAQCMVQEASYREKKASYREKKARRVRRGELALVLERWAILLVLCCILQLS